MNRTSSSEPKRSASTYDPTYGFLCDLWEQTKLFHSTVQREEFVHALLADLELRLVAMVIVLRARERMGFSGGEGEAIPGGILGIRGQRHRAKGRGHY